MCNQNIISNKFDLKLVTMFSSYWCTVIFTKSCSLHYVLKKQRKSTESEKRHWREEWRLPNRPRQKQQTTPSKEKQTHSQVRHAEELKCFQNNVNKRFQTMKPMTLTRTEQRIWKSRHLFIREIKLTHSQNVHH